MFKKLALTASLTMLAACFSSVRAAEKSSPQAMEVEELSAAPGVEIPADFRASLAINILEQVGQLHFKEVLRAGDAPKEEASSTLRLGGTVTKFDRGNRAARYWAPGMGATKVKAHIIVTDKKSGEKLYEADVSGSVYWGMFGGDSMGATHGLAKSVAKKVKERFLK